jgi:hypothetical protein
MAGYEGWAARGPGEDVMRSMRMYLMGYVVLLGGIVAGLWKAGVLERVGVAWTAIAIVVAIGMGIMLSYSLGETKTVEVEGKH